MGISCPTITVIDVLLNANNPFKKTIRRSYLKCKMCGEIVLKKQLSSQKDWAKVKEHLKKHNIDEDGGIPVRLLSQRFFKIWVNGQIKKRGLSEL